MNVNLPLFLQGLVMLAHYGWVVWRLRKSRRFVSTWSFFGMVWGAVLVAFACYTGKLSHLQELLWFCLGGTTALAAVMVALNWRRA